MKAFSIRLAGASLIALAAAGCTTTGIGTGQVVGQNIGVNFSWTETGGTRGTMIAQLSNGEVYQGPMFQITSESVSDYDPLWNGWGPWGPSMETITHYSGQVLANLQGPGGFMRCDFRLMRPSYGMAGGGLGQCQLPNGTIINAQFPPH